MTISREQLYEEVWAEPMTKVAARYGVSSSYLARICGALSVPRPARGHWAKCCVGKAPERPALREALLGDAIEWSRSGEAARSDALPVLPRKPRGRPIPSERPPVHPLLVSVKSHCESGRERDGYLRPSKRKLVDVFTSKESLDQALATANTIFDALEARGHRVCLAPNGSSYHRPPVDPRDKLGRQHYFGPSWAPANATVVFIGTLAIGLSLFELSEEVPMLYRGGNYVRVDSLPPRRASPDGPAEWTTNQDLPSGRLCLRAYCPYGFASWSKEWRESKPGDLDSRATKIARELIAEAPAILALIEEGKRRAEIERRRWEEEHREWERAEDEQRRAKALEASRSELLGAIARWGEANRIDAFFRAVEARIDALPEQESGALRERLKLGREVLGSVDALARFRDWREGA